MAARAPGGSEARGEERHVLILGDTATDAL